MKVTRLTPTELSANCYILGEEGEDCLLFDYGMDPKGMIARYIAAHHKKLLGVFLTHGHFDHIAGLSEIAPLDCPIFLSEDDFICLSDPHFNASKELMGEAISLPEWVNPYPLDDEDEIKLGGVIIQAIATPFHTKGSMCFLVEDEGILFSGDTLFSRGIGRYDLRGAEPRKIESSLAKLKELPPETKVYPGHGPATTIGEEARYNPYLR